ncbi:relaxase/mobilization nuclease domain-containing protein [Maribacter sp. PR1]|nr:relaxase/mobilization nuclease domain-containing protein [Maribacter sp. PR1]MDC6390435.1 relaxase/mobilization nuclease domain-containing protein [Maribacter sp. PR1]
MLNLPQGEYLDDKTFCKISEEYLENMSYGKPYIVIRHSDRGHGHVHIVMINVTDDGRVLGNLLDSSGYKEEEMFNGFKDELKDRSKYKGKELLM